MVAVTVEEALAMKRRLDGAVEDAMPKWQRENIGASVRIDLPLRDPYTLRKIQPLLAGLVEHIRITSHRTDLSEYDLMMSIRNYARLTTLQIRDIHGDANSNGTYKKTTLK